MENIVENICHIYLQHHPFKVNIQGYYNLMHPCFTRSFKGNGRLMGR
jgi:hypothetical protein